MSTRACSHPLAGAPRSARVCASASLSARALERQRPGLHAHAWQQGAWSRAGKKTKLIDRGTGTGRMRRRKQLAFKQTTDINPPTRLAPAAHVPAHVALAVRGGMTHPCPALPVLAPLVARPPPRATPRHARDPHPTTAHCQLAHTLPQADGGGLELSARARLAASTSLFLRSATRTRSAAACTSLCSFTAKDCAGDSAPPPLARDANCRQRSFV